VHSLIVVGPILILIVIAVAVTVPYIVGRFLPDRHREGLLKSTLATGGTMVSPFMLVLGFMVVVLWGQINDAQTTIEREAVALGDVASLVSGLDPSVGGPVRADVIAYAEAAAAEWPSLGRGTASPDATRAFRTLRVRSTAMSR
jgi:hypothetical protein